MQLHHDVAGLGIPNGAFDELSWNNIFRGFQLVGLGQIVEVGLASHLTVFDDVAQHHYSLHLFLRHHAEEITDGSRQWSLRHDVPSILEVDMVGVDVVELFAVLPLEDHSRMLIYIIFMVYRFPARSSG